MENDRTVEDVYKRQESIRQGMADAVGLDGLLDGVLDIGEGTGGNGAGIGERRTIEELKLPEQMKRILIENNNREVYQMLGVEQFGDYVGGYLADTVVKAAASILLFAVVFILLHIVAAWLDPVSYTHLDVYKRQDRSEDPGDDRTGDPGHGSGPYAERRCAGAL